jgi:hypothetical protein
VILAVYLASSVALRAFDTEVGAENPKDHCRQVKIVIHGGRLLKGEVLGVAIDSFESRIELLEASIKLGVVQCVLLWTVSDILSWAIRSPLHRAFVWRTCRPLGRPGTRI